MNHDELGAIRARHSEVDLMGGDPGQDYRDIGALLAELDRKTLLLERYGAQLEDVRREAENLEIIARKYADGVRGSVADTLREIVGPR